MSDAATPQPSKKFAGISKRYQSIGGAGKTGETPPQTEGVSSPPPIEERPEKERTRTERTRRKAQETSTYFIRQTDGVKMKRQSVNLPVELADRLKIYAVREHEDMNSIIEFLVSDFLEQVGG